MRKTIYILILFALIGCTKKTEVVEVQTSTYDAVAYHNSEQFAIMLDYGDSVYMYENRGKLPEDWFIRKNK